MQKDQAMPELYSLLCRLISTGKYLGIEPSTLQTKTTAIRKSDKVQAYIVTILGKDHAYSSVIRVFLCSIIFAYISLLRMLRNNQFDIGMHSKWSFDRIPTRFGYDVRYAWMTCWHSARDSSRSITEPHVGFVRTSFWANNSLFQCALCDSYSRSRLVAELDLLHFA